MSFHVKVTPFPIQLILQDYAKVCLQKVSFHLYISTIQVNKRGHYDWFKYIVYLTTAQMITHFKFNFHCYLSGFLLTACRPLKMFFLFVCTCCWTGPLLNKQFLVMSFFYVCRLLCLKLLRTGSEDPHHHEQEFLIYYLII